MRLLRAAGRDRARLFHSADWWNAGGAMRDITAHGGAIVLGLPTVLIG
jgi:hypothetical protein